MSVSAALLLGLVSCCLHRSAAGAQLAPPHSVSMAPPHSVRMAPPHSVSMAPPHSVRMAPPHSVRMAPPHSVSMAPPHSVSMAPPHSVRMAPPHSVRMVTLNTRYALSWSYHSDSASFTTQFLPKFRLQFNRKKKRPTWTTACNHTSQWSCDLTNFNLHYLGIYLVRVQATGEGRSSSGEGRNSTGEGRSSDWVEIEFCPDKDAAVGPPAVGLVPVGSDLEVSITDPRTSTNSSMRDLLPGLYYHVHYWGHSQDTSVRVVSTQSNMVTLVLRSWTWYCISVQSRCDFYQKRSNFSSTHCIQTQGGAPWWQVSMLFLGSLTCCFLLVVLLLSTSFFFYRTFTDTFYPENKLPDHFQQFPHDSPASDIPPLLPLDSEPLLYDRILLCPEPRLWEQEVPPEDCSYQVSSSSSSGDSGVESTGADSTGADSTGTGSTGLDSTGADSTGADSTGLDSTGLDSTGADSTGADSTGADSTGADSAGADSTGADSTGADSTGADSAGADSAGLDSTGADSTGADSTGLDSTGADSTGADSTGADSAGADSAGLDSTGADSTGADSTGADSAGADSTGADSTGADSTGADSTGADSAGADSAGLDSTEGCSSGQQPVPAALGGALGGAWGSRAPEQVKMQELKSEAPVVLHRPVK